MDLSTINWLLVAVVVIIVVGVIIGAIKGLLKMLFSFVAVILAIGLTVILTPKTANMLMKNEKVYNFIYSKAESAAQKNATIDVILRMPGDGEGGFDMKGFLLALGLPEALVNTVSSDKDVVEAMENSEGATPEEATENIRTAAYGGVTKMIIKAMAFLITLAVVALILWLLSNFTTLVNNIPVVGKINAFAGAVAGAIIAVALVQVLFTFFTMISTTAFGQSMLQYISESKILTFIHEHNIITRRISS